MGAGPGRPRGRRSHRHALSGAAARGPRGSGAGGKNPAASCCESPLAAEHRSRDAVTAANLSSRSSVRLPPFLAAGLGDGCGFLPGNFAFLIGESGGLFRGGRTQRFAVGCGSAPLPSGSACGAPRSGTAVLVLGACRCVEGPFGLGCLKDPELSPCRTAGVARTAALQKCQDAKAGKRKAGIV